MIEAQTRVQKMCAIQSCFSLTKSEVQFVLNFPRLNDKEKLVWIALAIKSSEDPDFTCNISLQQFAQTLGMRPMNVMRAISELKAMGFLNCI